MRLIKSFKRQNGTNNLYHIKYLGTLLPKETHSIALNILASIITLHHAHWNRSLQKRHDPTNNAAIENFE